MPGLKAFIKFSERFYRDAVFYETTDSDEKMVFDVALRKGSEDNVTGSSLLARIPVNTQIYPTITPSLIRF